MTLTEAREYRPAWAAGGIPSTPVPPGRLAGTARRLRTDPRVPRRAKIAIIAAGLYVASPIDLVPEFIPVIGPLDDIVVVALALRYAGRRVPRDILLAAWPGQPRLIERLLGTPRRGTTRGPD